MENHCAQKSLPEREGHPPPLTEKIREVVFEGLPKSGYNLSWCCIRNIYAEVGNCFVLLKEGCPSPFQGFVFHYLSLIFIRLDAKDFFSAKRSTRQQQVFDCEKTLLPSCGAWMHCLWRTLWPSLSSWAFDLGNKHYSLSIIHYYLTNFQLIVYLHTWINGQCLDFRVYLT